MSRLRTVAADLQLWLRWLRLTCMCVQAGFILEPHLALCNNPLLKKPYIYVVKYAETFFLDLRFSVTNMRTEFSPQNMHFSCITKIQTL